MSGKREIVINGKFLFASLEGMPRVGRELCASFDELLAEDRYSALKMTIATPRGGSSLASYKRIPVVEVGRRSGFAWEQIDFPFHVGRRYSVNFTNTAPVLRRNGCVVVHDAQFMSTKASHTLKSRLLYGGVTPWVAKRYKTIVSVSNYARDELLQYGVCDRGDIQVIPNGVDHVLRRKADAGTLDRHGLAAQGYLLANGYVQAHKNVGALLKALASTGPAYPLALFGNSDRATFEARGLPVPDGVKFLGRVSDEELVALMRNARMFLFPSTTEGFGLPPLEAMLLGCPTICASAGAMPETCGDAVLYADPHRPDLWASQIERLWNDDAERTALAAAGRRQADGFRWLNSARAYLDLFLREL
jgi:glycosyltransferase involved in cell wall biosynthesis